MKKTKEKSIKVKNLLIIIGVILIICVVGVLLSPSIRNLKPIYPLNNLFGPEFTIYEEVCRNETVLSAQKWVRIDVTYIDCNKTITYDKIFKYCWNETDSDWICDEDYCLFRPSYSTDFIIEIKAEKYREKIETEVFEPFNSYKEVCEQVEVDLDWEEECLRISENACFSPKYDGIKWLDENCERQRGKCLKWGRRNSKGIAICKNELSKYKCGDYIVEVEE